MGKQVILEKTHGQDASITFDAQGNFHFERIHHQALVIALIGFLGLDRPYFFVEEGNLRIQDSKPIELVHPEILIDYEKSPPLPSYIVN